MIMSGLAPIALMGLLLALVGTTVWVSIRGMWSHVTVGGVFISTVPSLCMVGSFYALAWHMYVRFGGWPESIGVSRFPASLLTHAHITTSYFGMLLIIVVFGGPIVLLTCSLIPHLRRYIPYITTGEIAFAVCFILMLFGPSEFLYWWWD